MAKINVFEGAYNALDPYEHDLRPFDSNKDAWEAGHQLIMELAWQRGLSTCKRQDPRWADVLIRNYAHRIRTSGPWIDLARLQRAERLSDVELIIVVSVMATLFEFTITWRTKDPVILAVGFEPRQLQQVYNAILNGQGIGRLVELHDNTLRPSKKLFDLILQEREPASWEEIRNQIIGLPTASRDS